MNPSRPKARRTRSSQFAPELLEGRELMTGGVGNTFAIIPATITQAGGHATVSFNLDPKVFTDPGNKPFVLGIDVAANSNSTASAKVVSVVTPSGKTLTASHALFDPTVKRTGADAANLASTAGLVTIPGNVPKVSHASKAAKGSVASTALTSSYVYKVNISAIGKTSGSVLVGFYLPGNASGGGTVNTSDLNAVKYAQGVNANDTTGKYSFDADADRNGVINAKDLAIAQQNLGVGTTVSPVISANLDPASVTDATNRVTNLPQVHVTGTATPGATIVYSATNIPAVTSVTDATGNYSIMLPLLTGANTFNVIATDMFDQKITGSIASITRD